MFKKILLAVDGSRHSDLAVDYAAGLARAFKAALLVVHAYPQTSDLLGYQDFETLVARRKATGQTVVDKVRERLENSGLDFQEDLLEGPEADAILAAGRAHEVDLIIMGTRGLGTIEGVLFGSVSRKVSQHAHCPVMLIR
jgi:nucleotide-binding universal stress UspA family protein